MDIFVRFLNPLLMIALGLGLGVLIARRLKVDWGLFGVGAVTFIGSQVLHIPFNQRVLNPLLSSWGVDLATLSSGVPTLVGALALGFSAGVFEEAARYLVLRFWKKDTRSWPETLMYGAGHGGSEAIIFGVLALVTAIRIISLEGVDLATIVPEEQLSLAQAQIDAFWALPWYGVMLGTLERAIALCIHLSAALIVLQAFRRRNLAWLGLAIAWHTLVDAVAVYSLVTWGVYVTEGVMIPLALLGIWIVFKLRTPDERPGDSLAPPPPMQDIKPVEITDEILEDSRYAS